MAHFVPDQIEGFEQIETAKPEFELFKIVVVDNKILENAVSSVRRRCGDWGCGTHVDWTAIIRLASRSWLKYRCKRPDGPSLRSLQGVGFHGRVTITFCLRATISR